MKIFVDSSVLVSGSIVWEYSDKKGKFLLKHKHFNKCEGLLNFLKLNSALQIGVITKTVENESKSVIRTAVNKTLNYFYSSTLMPEAVRKMLSLHYLVTTASLDRLDNIIEESSIRLPINIQKREDIKKKEIEPFLKELVAKTVRYRQPHIPSSIKGEAFRGELTDIIIANSPAKQIVYKGMPEDKDLTIMAEATLICREYKEKIYVASMDNNFKPNPVQVGSYKAGYSKYAPEIDSTVRDELANKFGFIGEEPSILMTILKTELPTATFPS